MAITRPQKKKPAVQIEKIPKSADEFINSAQSVSHQQEIEPEASMIHYIPAKTLRQRAIIIMESYLPWAAASGIMPIPALDLAAILAVQLRMLSKIGNIYGIQFKEQAARSAITVLMVGCLQQTFAVSLYSTARFIPVIGVLASITIFPALAMASTYAIGQVFIKHFEAGGTYIDFDPWHERTNFNQQFKKAKQNRLV